jgi:hypothetical protein
MKMLMMIVESNYKEQLEVLLNSHEIVGYTEIPQVFGSGTTGTRMGSRAFPKTSSVLFTVLDDDVADTLAANIKEFCAACAQHMHMIVWHAEKVF